MDRVILHSDMNNCYASIELLHHPELRGRPLAVGGDSEARHGIVLAKDQIAKKAGVKTGMAIWQARQVCPEIQFVPPRMDLYLRFSRLAHEIYGEYTDKQEAFGVDESWLDVTDSCSLKGDGMTIAAEISHRIKFELGITVSIGVSWNKIFAKLGSDYKKPDAITEINREITGKLSGRFRQKICSLSARPQRESYMIMGSAQSGSWPRQIRVFCATGLERWPTYSMFLPMERIRLRSAGKFFCSD